MKIVSVSEFLQILNDTLITIDPYREIFVEGEVASYKVSQEKWVWFDLKDENGIMNCFTTTWQLKVPLEDGMKIRVNGYSSIYKKSGKLSFQVKEIELVGEGALKKAYEALKKKLATEGLFDIARKRTLPRFSSRLALITSGEAAAYTDFIKILNNRWGGVEVDLLSVAVQGKSAIQEIVNAFKWLNNHATDYDVCVLTRGGGSMEDLIAFNSEEVARAVYGSKVPVVCGIGHERDECLAEYVADVRASTPTNAAERVVPEKRDILAELNFVAQNLDNRIHYQLTSKITDINRLFSLVEHSARRPLEICKQTIINFGHRFDHFLFQIEKNLKDLANYEKTFTNLDPRRLLKRGFSIVRSKSGAVVRCAGEVSLNEEIMVELGQGSLGAQVKKIN